MPILSSVTIEDSSRTVNRFVIKQDAPSDGLNRAPTDGLVETRIHRRATMDQNNIPSTDI